jgi:hypothetical protein
VPLPDKRLPVCIARCPRTIARIVNYVKKEDYMLRKTVVLLILMIIYAYAEWTATGSLLSGHSAHAAITLGNGDVLAMGGSGSRVCQIYDHDAQTWSYTDSLTIGRQNLEAVLLQDGRVMVIGGGYPYGLGHGTCEIYDTVTHTWAMTDTLNTARAYAQAVVLDDGRVLVTGGLDIMTLISACEIWDPTTETWTLTNSLPEPQWGHDICLLNDGRVLSVGGFRDFGTNMAGCHIFDPVSDTWTTTNPLNYRRWKLSAVKLITGNVLVAGGQDQTYYNIPQCEIYDVNTDTWSLTNNAIDPGRIGHACIAFKPDDPRVMLIGGEGALSDCELYNVYSGEWEDTDALNPGRGNLATTLLNNGNVLVVGGNPASTDCQIFIPPPQGVSEHGVEAQLVVLTAAPNPFQHNTTVQYSLDNTARVSIRVYDITGTLVRTIVDQNAVKGSRTITWYGDNTKGERLPAGIYFMELKAGDLSAAQKILLTD